MTKQTLLTIDNVRIKEYDSMNVIVERFEETYNPFEKENISKWQLKGYFPTVFDALKGISRNEWLIDYKAVHDLKSYLYEVRGSNNKLLEAKK
ncbi:hypothetical protein J2Z83_003759 [Virgibacillus natechei]|uniref:Phage protein n=1 Tax=Virgibacillus natechei TaxID=1216297 RepID=A0ABS4IKX3_9BACI|nr:hypothetical protein [Virgibacillus natechei]MBP1971608.1 hypothetical protein [Virgibacillus natechei]UZD13062.1 hypothetical protein OLD84_00335 [Virgibacillus natechei]